jgi:hypothetical protein
MDESHRGWCRGLVFSYEYLRVCWFRIASVCQYSTNTYCRRRNSRRKELSSLGKPVIEGVSPKMGKKPSTAEETGAYRRDPPPHRRSRVLLSAHTITITTTQTPPHRTAPHRHNCKQDQKKTRGFLLTETGKNKYITRMWLFVIVVVGPV